MGERVEDDDDDYGREIGCVNCDSGWNHGCCDDLCRGWELRSPALSTPATAQGDVREALEPYTQHLVGCRMRLRMGAGECTCGLAAALATLGAPHEG